MITATRSRSASQPRSLLLGVLLTSAVAAHAAQAQNTGTVRGRVVDQNGRGIENAQIELTPTARRTTTLDDGRFTIANVRGGVYVLSVRRIGYEAAEMSFAVADSVVPLTVTLVAVPEQLDAIHVREKAEGIRYSAVVLDQFDQPVADAQIDAMGVTRELRTDLYGRFTVARLERGTLMLRIRKIGFAARFDSFRILADRADTIRVQRLADSLTPVEINEQSGFGLDEWAYRDLDQRMRWKASGVGSISREELAAEGRANLCEAVPRTSAGSRFVFITPTNCNRKFYRVLLDGATCQTRSLADFTADQVAAIEYFPPQKSPFVKLLWSDISENLTRRNCPPEVFVIWLRHDVENAAKAVVAEQSSLSTADTSAQHAKATAGDPQSATAPVKPSHLQGQVVDSAGRPVRAAVVYTDDPPRATLSDKGGFFKLPELSAGPTTVRVQRDGFVGTEFQLRLPPDSTVGIGVKLFASAPVYGTAQVDSTIDADSTLQARRVRVVSTDGAPIEYANIAIDGAATRITDEKGQVSLGAGKRQSLTVRVSRIGYAPWFGRVDLPESAMLTVTLPRIAQSLKTVTVNGEAPARSALAMTGFYDRWMMRQRGALSAVFIGPEEIEFRHPTKVSRMLQGLNGVRLICSVHGDCTAYSTGQTSLSIGDGCPMAILFDGHQAYGLNIDQAINVSDVMAIEVYPRGGNMPVGLQANDTNCGVVAIWTGSRKKP
jgi:hypothetical protein